MPITWPSNTVTIIDEIRGAIGRDVTFIVLASSVPCPVCSLDPVTNTSTDSFCLVCSGVYHIPVYSGYTTSGHVTWGKLDKLEWLSGGQYYDGDCRVQIKYTTEHVTIVDNTKWLEVDGKQMEIKKRIYRGVQPLNRILLDLIERDNNV